MIGLEEARELSRLAGGPLAMKTDGYKGDLDVSGVMVPVADLERILELANLVQSDAEVEADNERLKQRAQDYEDLPEYVQSMLDEGHPDGYWDVLEKVLDDLDRGYSDTIEEYAEWRKNRRWAAIQEQKHLVDLYSAADSWKDHRQQQLQLGVGRGEQLRIEAEAKRLQPALDWAWEKLK